MNREGNIHTKKTQKKYKKISSIFRAGLFALLLFSGMQNNIIAAPVQPDLPTANEVVYTEASTARVATPAAFSSAYTNSSISRIILDDDIDISSVQGTIRAHNLVRSLQIDGNGNTLSAKQFSSVNDYIVMNVYGTSGSTIHLKDMTIISGGENFISDGNVNSRSRNWQVILDNVKFPKNTSGYQVQRVLVMRQGHLFLRNNVEMYSYAENMYIGQITVEKNADVYGEINYYDFSTWWFVDYQSQGSLNIGEGAKVSLNGVGGVTYPTVFEHFREINVHKNATLISRKPGNSLRFNATLGVSNKYINVFEGATLDAASTGTGSSPIIDTLGTGYAGHFYAAPNSKVLLIGSSSTDATPLINLPNSGSSFTLDHPQTYDLRNNRTTGYVVSVGSGATFSILNSDIEVWKKGSGVNLNIQPTYSWFRSNVVANNSGNPITGTDPSVAAVWKTMDYARITGLNANPTLKFREVTDADKNFVVEAYVLDNLAWANQVNVSVTNDKDSEIKSGQNDASGLFKYTRTDFYKAGTVLTATGYRGVVEWPTLDPQATTTVKDVTPPTPAVVNGFLPSNASTVSGTSDEPGSTVTLSLNGTIIRDAENNVVSTTVDGEGKWTFTFPDNINLNVNDTLQVFLTDTSGNTNPTVNTPFKDAVFLRGSIINVISEPKINAEDFVEVNLNSTYNPVTGVSATDSRGNAINFGTGEFDLKFTTNVDTTTIGVYTTTYTMIDQSVPSITTTKTTKVLVKGENTVIDYENKFMINAHNYQLRQGTDIIAGTNTEILSHSNARSWSLDTGQIVSSSVVNNGGYHNAIGGYEVEIGVASEPIVKTKIIASILGANTVVDSGYALDANDFVIAKDKVSGTADFTKPEYGNAIAWNLSDLSDSLTIGVVDDDGYSTLKSQGKYNVTLKINEHASTTKTISAIIIAKDVVGTGSQYIIGANNVTIGKAEAQNIQNDADLISTAKAMAWKRTDINNPVNVMVKTSNFVAAVGEYEVTFGVMSEPTTEATIKVTVIDNDHAFTGENYIIAANNFSINTTQAATINETDILTRSLARAWQIKDEDVTGTVKVTANTIQATQGIYDVELYVDDDPDTKVTIQVNVTNGQAPALSVSTPVEINVGGTFDPHAGVSAIDSEDGDISENITYTGTYDVNTAGIYVLTYSITDSDYNNVEKTRVLVVNDGRYVVGTKYIIEASNFVINKPDVNTADNAIINNAQARAFSAIDGSNADVIVTGKGGYHALAGQYTITFAVDDERSTVRTVTANVIDKDVINTGSTYSIAANNVVIGKDEARTITNSRLLELSQAESWLNTNFATKGSVTVDDISPIQPEAGVYNIMLKVTEEPTTQVTIQVRVIDRDVAVEGNEYAIAANNVTIGRNEAQAVTNNQDLINLTQAYSWEKSDINTHLGVTVISSGFVSAPGAHRVTFGAEDEPTTRVQVTITVVDYDHAKSGDNYIIAANNFSINTTEAASITEGDILTKSSAISWFKETMNTSGTIKITENTIEATQGVYHIELYVEEEPDVKITIQVNVTNGAPPVLNVTNPVEINVNDSFDPMMDVSAIDPEEDDITDQITHTGTYNTSKAGVYVLTYSVTDSDYNTVSAIRLLIVNDGTYVIGTDYVIGAGNFIINAQDVDTSDEAIIAQAKAESYARAFEIETGNIVDTIIVDKGGYQAVAGDYNIIFGVAEEASTTKTIKATVVDKDVLTVGDTYSIGANNITIGRRDAQNINDSKILTLSKAEAWLNTDYTIKGEANVLDSSALQSTPGVYQVSLNVVEEPTTRATINVRVTDNDYVVEGEEYGIAANDVTIGVKEAEALLNEEDFINSAAAHGWKKSDLSNTSISVDKTGFVAAPGEYDVEFSVNNETDTKVSVKFKVLDYDHGSSGKEYVIGANNFSINTTVASTISINDIINRSNAKSWQLDDEDADGTVRVITNTIQPEIGIYNVVLYVEEEPTTRITIQVNVTNGAMPVLTVTNPIEINVGDSFAEMDGVTATDAESGNLIDEVTINGSYNVNEAGIYVLTYSVTDSDYNTATAKRVLIVNDGRYTVGDEYIVSAQDFIINKADVSTADSAIINRAKAQAYKVSDGSSANVVISDKGGYQAIAGEYSMIIASENEPDTTRTIKARVIDKDVVMVGDTYSIGANHIVIGIQDAKNIDDEKILTLSKAEAWLNTDYSTKGTPKVKDRSTIQSVPGTYNVVLEVDEENETQLTIRVTVVNRDTVTEGTGYSIGANNVVIGKNQAQEIADDQDLINLTNASAWEKNNINNSANVSVIDSEFTSAVGEYSIIFGVSEEISTTVMVTITVLDYNHVTSGTEYIIGANNFTINTTQAATIDEAGIISHSNATSFLRETLGISGTVKVTENTIGLSQAVYNVELYVEEEPTTKVIIQVNVSDGSAPVLSVTNPIEINVGGNFDPAAGVSASDSEDGNLTDKVTFSGTYDVNEAGIYVLTYSVQDKDFNRVNATRILVVNDGRYTVGTEYIIEARDFVVNKVDVDATDFGIINSANAHGYKVSDGSSEPVFVSNNGNYNASTGQYNITLSIQNELTTRRTIQATVIDKDVITIGESYSIGANNIIIGKKDVATINDERLLQLSAAEAWLNSDYATKGTVAVEDSQQLQETPGVYNVTLNIEEEENTKAVITVTVLDSDTVVEGNQYVIGANDVIISRLQAETLTSNQDFIDLNQAKAWLRSDLNSTVPVLLDGTDFVATKGDYSITFKVADELDTRVTVSIKVVDNDEITVGNQYIIGANNFTINTTQAATINDNEIIAKAAANAFLKENELTAGTVKVTENTIEDTEGVYDVEFYVEEEPATKVTIKVTVSDGEVPVISFTNPVEINVGASFDSMADVSATDEEDEDLTEEVEVSGFYDVNTAGVYLLTYTVTDSDHNTVSAKRMLVVNDGTYVIGTDYVIGAENFVVNKPDVDISDAVIKSKAQAKAYKISDGTNVEVSVINKGGYTNTVGTYEIVFGVADEITTTKTIKATVIDKNVVVVGDSYSIGANNITIGKETARALNDAKILELSQAQAWQNSNFEETGIVNVEDSSAVSEQPGTYNVILNVAQEPTTKTTITVTVVDKDIVNQGNQYSIGANNVIIGKSQASQISGNQGLIDLTQARAWERNDFNNEATVAVVSSNFVAAPGDYTVTFAVSNEITTTIDVNITVLDRDIVKTGNSYVIGANNFSINTTQAATIDEAGIISNSNATSWLKETMAISGTVKVIENTIETTPGIYNIELYVEQEPATKIVIEVNVNDGAAPVLTVTNPVEINVGGSFNPMAGVSATDNENGDLTDEVTFSGFYDVNTAGVYVLTYSVTDSDFNVVTAIRLLVVNDGTYVVGTEYIISAQNFIINKPDVDTDSNAVIAKAQANAYKISDASIASVVISDTDGYTAQKGVYNIEFAVENETTTTRTIQATVIDYDKVTVGDEYSIGANNIVIGKNDALNMTDAKLLTLTNAKAWPNNDYNGLANVEVADRSLIEAVPGIYNATLRVAEENETKTTVQVRVVDNDTAVEGDSYVIGADNKIISLKQAQTIQNDDDLINLMNARAWEKANMSNTTDVEIESSDFVQVAGLYNITFRVIDESDTKVTVTLRVLPTEEIVSGSNYIIGANNFTINSLVAGTIDEAGIIDRADATSWFKQPFAQSGDVKVTANTIGTTPGTYNVELYVEQEPTTKITIQVSVQNGNPPVLNVTNPVEISVGGVFDPRMDISAIDIENGDITGEITYSGSFDTSTPGIYPITYSVTDLDGNTVTALRLLVVNDGRFIIGDDYIVEAQDFVIRKKDVVVSSNAIIQKAQAKAYQISDGAQAQLTVVDDNGYSNVEGTYSIKISPTNETTTFRTIKATVVDRDQVTTGSQYAIASNNVIIGLKEANSLQESDLIALTGAKAFKKDNITDLGTVEIVSTDFVAQPGTYTVNFKVAEESNIEVTSRIVVINNDHVKQGSNYFISGNDFNLSLNDAKKITASKLIKEGRVQAQSVNTVLRASNATVSVESHTIEPSLGTYTVTYNVVEEPTTKITVNVKVIDNDHVVNGVNYVIVANDFNLTKDEAKKITNQQLITKASAMAWQRIQPNTTGTVKVLSSNIVAQAGTYKVSFFVQEEPDTKVTVIVKVIDTSKEKPADPIINPITEGDHTISGTGTPGSTIIITLPNGKTIKTVVAKDGKWSVKVPDNIKLKKGDLISAVAIKDGLKSNKVTTRVLAIPVSGIQLNWWLPLSALMIGILLVFKKSRKKSENE